MLQIFIKGGPIMWPLLLLSILTMAVILERVYFLMREKFSREKDIVQTISQLVAAGEIDRAALIGQRSRDVVGRVLGEGLENAESCYEEAISSQAERELDRYSQGVSLLDTAVTLAPLLGLLGTVTGMIRSFGLLGASELEAPVAITGGIAEALIATGFGLTIAIIALLPLNALHSVKDTMTREIEDAASRIEILLKSRLGRVSKQSKAA